MLDSVLLPFPQTPTHSLRLDKLPTQHPPLALFAEWSLAIYSGIMLQFNVAPKAPSHDYLFLSEIIKHEISICYE